MRAIEYIGPVPGKKKKRSALGGALILLMSLAFTLYFVWPVFADYVMGTQVKPNTEMANEAMIMLTERGDTGDLLAASALVRSQLGVEYDGAYYEINYPMGDVPSSRGVACDVVVRSYRELGIDLQELVHEDMTSHFRRYPQLWGALHPDPNIDHRRVENLERYFERHGEVLPNSRDEKDYAVGEVVSWRLPSGKSHIGMVVPGPGRHADRLWVVHNVGQGTHWEDALFDYEVIGHYRYPK